MSNKKLKSYFFGLFAEYWVIFILFFKGYLLLKHRYKTKYGEIDLIFKKGKTIIAVEVKARSDKNILIGNVVSKNQVNRIITSLKFFLNKNKKYITFNYRFDIILVYNNFIFKHLKNIIL